MTTINQLNNIAQLGKWIMGFLGILLGIVFWGTFYGTSYLKETKYSIDTLGRNVKSLNANFIEFKNDTKSNEKELKDNQSDMRDDIRYLLDHMGAHQIRSGFSTQTRDKAGHVTMHPTNQ